MRSVNPDVAATLHEATYKAFDNIVEGAVREKVDFVLFAGDLYNQNENNLQPQLRFRDGLHHLHEAGIGACVIRGNHDPLDGKSQDLKWPESCHCFPVTASEPHVLQKEGDPIAAVVGVSYGKRDVKESLLRRYKHEHKHLFTIGLLHTNCGTIGDHPNYAPCTLDDLRNKDFDYWALGHIHKHGVLNASKPTVVYAGTPQGLNPKETGVHGCYRVSVDGDRNATPEFIATSGIVWHREDVDASAWIAADDALDALDEKLAQIAASFEGRAVLVRLRIVGRSPLHGWLNGTANRRDLLNHLRQSGAREPFVWTEDVGIATQPDIDFAERRKGIDIVGEVLRQADSVLADEAELAAARQELGLLFGHQRASKFLEELSDDQLRSLIGQASIMAVDRLVGKGDA